jgi:hypothetical protein
LKRVVVFVAAFAVAAIACNGGPDARSDARLVPLSGEISVGREAAGEFVIEREMLLAPGDAVRADVDGWARIVWPDGRIAELAPETSVRLVGSRVIELLAGSVLVRATEFLAVDVAGTRVEGQDALFRVDRRLSSRIGVYEGRVRLPGSALDDPLEALRQIVLVGDSLSRAQVPLQVDPDDPWDAEILGDAIDVGLGLLRLERGVAAQLPEDQASALRAVLGVLPVRTLTALTPDLLAPLSPSEILLAGAVAGPVGRGSKAGIRSAFERVAALRGLGASWVVVAADLGLGSRTLERVAFLSGRLADRLRPIVPLPGSPEASGVGAGGGSGEPPEGSPSEPPEAPDPPEFPPGEDPLCGGLVGVVCDLIGDLLQPA